MPPSPKPQSPHANHLGQPVGEPVPTGAPPCAAARRRWPAASAGSSRSMPRATPTALTRPTRWTPRAATGRTSPTARSTSHESYARLDRARPPPATIRMFFAIVDSRPARAVGVAAISASTRARRDRGRPPQLLAAAAADARGDRGDVPDDAAGLTSSATAATNGSATRSTRRRGPPPSGSASATRACSARRRVYKGRNRDTAWYRDRSTASGRACARPSSGWLDPANFDERGNQKRRLGSYANQ